MTRPVQITVLGCVMVALVLGLLVAASAHYDYVAYVPGGATDLGDRITVTGAKEYQPKGKLYLATVGLTQRLNGVQIVKAWLDPDEDIKKYVEVYGDDKVDEQKVNRAMMDESKVTAELVALRYLGYQATGQGARIVEVVKGSPADGRLKAGDVVLSVNGSDICLNADLRAGIRSGGRTDAVTLEVKRTGTGAVEQVTVTPAYDTTSAVRYLGVVAETVKCTLPLDLQIDTGGIGGPSAGLSMTLAILDRLTPGELTGGTPVAATGTIEVDGTVGDVGGVRQKTAAVKAAGAKLFLVPPGEEAEARARAGGMPVVAVRTLTDALAALRRYGGQSLPSPGAAQ